MRTSKFEQRQAVDSAIGTQVLAFFAKLNTGGVRLAFASTFTWVPRVRLGINECSVCTMYKLHSVSERAGTVSLCL